MAQLIVDTVARGQSMFSGDSFNIVKFILSLMSIFFDLIFMFQHYVLYGDARKKDQKKNDRTESVSHLKQSNPLLIVELSA